MAFTSKSFTLARLLVLALLCWACIQPMVSLATPTQEETATFNALKAKAESGNAQAQVELGEAYEDGKNTTKNLTLAEKWLSKASEKECAYANFRLSKLYFFEEATVTQRKRGFYLAQKLAKQGSAEAQEMLGRMYILGFNVKSDIKTGLYWITKASDNGHYFASQRMGWLYEHGRYVKKDEAIAFSWYEKATRQNPFSGFELGDKYLKKGGISNWFKGLYWKTYAFIDSAYGFFTGKPLKFYWEC